jgi:hypothetical protein
MDNKMNLADYLVEYAKQEGIKISKQDVIKEIRFVFDYILTVGNRPDPDLSSFYSNTDLDIEDFDIEDIAFDIAVERVEFNDDNEYGILGICFYKKDEKLNYIFSSYNDKFQITSKGEIDLTEIDKLIKENNE